MASNQGLPSLRSRAGKERHRFHASYLKATEATAAALLLRQQQEEEQSAQPFRFMDLPLELQEMVCSFYAADVERKWGVSKSRTSSDLIEPGRLVAYAHIPALAHVCQEIRSGFINTFFREGRFCLLIGPCAERANRPSTTGIKLSLSWYPARYPAKKGLPKPSDPTYLSRHMKNLLQNATVVRNVTFSFYDLNYRYIRDSTDTQRQPGAPWKDSVREPLTLVLEWKSGNLEVQETPKTGHEIFVRSIHKAREICARGKFMGFTAKDLRHLARVMRRGGGFAGPEK